MNQHSTRRGVERSPESSGNGEVKGEGGAKCGALSSDLVSLVSIASRDSELPAVACDSSLAEVVERWPVLPEAIRIAILALVRTAN
jgi:hypothetical protein